MMADATTYIGSPCKRGHGGTRYVRNRECVECRRAINAASYAANPVMVRARQAAWHAANSDKVQARHTAYRAANSEKVRSRDAAYYAANTERVNARNTAYYAANATRGRACAAAWHKANPVACFAARARRRALKLAAPGRGVTAAQWQDVLDAARGLCAYCNERKPLTMDHIEPLSLGGAHDIDNIAAACQSCNSSKNDAPLVVWLARRALARVA